MNHAAQFAYAALEEQTTEIALEKSNLSIKNNTLYIFSEAARFTFGLDSQQSFSGQSLLNSLLTTAGEQAHV